VVPVAVGLEHLPHVEPLGEIEELVVLVGGVEQHGVAGLLAPQDVHVVVHRSDHDLVDLGLAVLVVEGIYTHETRLGTASVTRPRSSTITRSARSRTMGRCETTS